MLENFQTSDIYSMVKLVQGNQSDNHCNQSDTWLSIPVSELYQPTPSSIPHLKHTHTTHTHTHTCMHAHTHTTCTLSQVTVLCFNFFRTNQTNSWYTRQTADFVSSIWPFYPVKHWKLLVNMNPEKVGTDLW